MKKFLAILLVLTLALTGAALAEAAPDEYGQLAEEMERRADKAARRKAAGPKRKPGREHHE